MSARKSRHGPAVASSSGVASSPSDDTHNYTGHLAFQGKIYDKNSSPGEGGQIACLKNFVVKNHLWKFVHVVFNIHTSDFIAADERGQVYIFRLSDNSYSSLRLASFPISALEYVHTHASHVMVAYENGLVIIVDTLSKEIVANVRPRGSSPVVHIKCCPSNHLAVMLADNGQLILWNIKSLAAVETMQCQEAVVDVSFLLNAKWLAVTFVHSGTIIYDMATLQVVMKCVTPSGERHPRLWTSFCSTVSPHAGGVHSSFTAPMTKDCYAFLSGDNGSVYMFELNPKSAALSDPTAIPLCPMVGVFELPSHITMAVSMTIVTPRHVASSLSPHVFLIVLGNNGEVMLLDGCVTFSDSWQWCVLHAFNPFHKTIRSSHPRHDDVQLEPHIYAGPSSSSINISRHNPAAYCLASCSVEMESSYYVVIEDEGSVNLYDWNAFMDKYIVETEMGETERKAHHTLGSDDVWFKQCKWLSSRGQRSVPAAGRTAPPSLSVDTANLPTHDQDDHQSAQLSSGRNSSGSHDLTFLSPRKGNSTNVNGLTFSALNKKRSKAEDKEHNMESESHSKTSKGKKGHRSGKKDSTEVQAVSQNTSSYDRERPSISMILDSSLQRKAMTVSQLKKFLKKYGQYPAEHRTLIWRVLLRLPENEKSFTGLTSRGLHENYENLYDQYPIRERRVFKRLQGVCSQLAHWNAVFGDVDYIPQMVLPFVVMFAADELSALETVMTIIVWWGRSWQATFPNPPVHITDTLDVLLDKHDSGLRTHFYTMHVPPGIIGWKMLSTLFSELMPSAEWQVLMDHLFTHIEDYSLIYLVPVALMKLLRPSLLTATSSRQIISFLRQPQTIDIERLLKILMQMRTETSSHLLSACFTGKPSEDMEEGSSSKTSSRSKEKAVHLNLSTKDKDLINCRDSVGAHEGYPVFPLPRGGYPAFDGYPPHLLDWQSKERAMALSMKKEIRDNESCLKELQEKLSTIEDNHNLWMQSHRGAEEKEIKERKQLLEKDRRHMSELSVIEEKIARQRIENLYKIEEIERKELEAMEETKLKVQNLIQMTGEHMKEKVEQVVVSQEHREAGEEADRILQSKIQALYLNKRKETMLKETEEALRLKQEVIDSSNRLKVAVWQQEDNSAKVHRHQLSEQAKQKLHQQLIANQKREIDEQAKLLVLEREAKLLEIERLRTLRSIKEEHSMRLLESKEDELSKQEEMLKHTLADASEVSTRVTSMKDLLTRREISQPRDELQGIALQMKSSHEKSEEANLEVAMAEIQRDHESKMQQMAQKKEALITEKAKSLEKSVVDARNYVDKSQVQGKKRLEQVQQPIEKKNIFSLSDTVHVDADVSLDSSIRSGDSDVLFQQALRFINQQSFPRGLDDDSGSDGGGGVSEDVIISALEIVSNSGTPASSAQKPTKKSPSPTTAKLRSSSLHGSAEDGLIGGNIESLVAAELTDMLSISSSVSDPSFHDDFQHLHARRRQQSDLKQTETREQEDDNTDVNNGSSSQDASKQITTQSRSQHHSSRSSSDRSSKSQSQSRDLNEGGENGSEGNLERQELEYYEQRLQSQHSNLNENTLHIANESQNQDLNESFNSWHDAGQDGSSVDDHEKQELEYHEQRLQSQRSNLSENSSRMTSQNQRQGLTQNQSRSSTSQSQSQSQSFHSKVNVVNTTTTQHTQFIMESQVEQVDPEISVTSNASSKSLEILERITSRAYKDLESYDDDSLQADPDQMNYNISELLEASSHLTPSSGSTSSGLSKTSGSYHSGSMQSGRVSHLAADEALWAYTMSGREEFKDLAAEFSEDELDETNSV